jgi:threonine/homoserine/homoserine lactone efflux protein
MPSLHDFLLFLLAATAISLTPGPGLLYVAARTLAAGRGEGLASTLGLALGGQVHVLGGALGVSALLVASAEAFTVFKLLGAAYLVWLGWRTWRTARVVETLAAPAPVGRRRAFRDGILVEALNPKTAAFFLAFIPQFVDPAAGPAFWQFLLLGTVTVVLNGLSDLAMILLADRVAGAVRRRPRVLVRIRRGSAAIFCALGLGLALARRPA